MYYNIDIAIKTQKSVIKQRKRREDMKSTGVVRRVDELGRIVLPAELRHSMDIHIKDALEIFTEGDRIILQKYHPACVFCDSVDNVVFFREKRICKECLEKLKSET